MTHSDVCSFTSVATTLTPAEALVKDWPALSANKARRVAALLGNGTPQITMDDYRTWEIRRAMDSQVAA